MDKPIQNYWKLRLEDLKESFPKGRIKVVLINEDLGF